MYVHYYPPLSAFSAPMDSVYPIRMVPYMNAAATAAAARVYIPASEALTKACIVANIAIAPAVMYPHVWSLNIPTAATPNQAIEAFARFAALLSFANCEGASFKNPNFALLNVYIIYTAANAKASPSPHATSATVGAAPLGSTRLTGSLLA